MRELYPELIRRSEVCDVEQSLNDFLFTLRSLNPNCRGEPTIALQRDASAEARRLSGLCASHDLGVRAARGCRPLFFLL